TLYVRKVEGIDLDNKVVITSHGFRPEPSVLPYNYLVLALGTLENFGVVRGLQEHGLHFKTLGDALALRNRLIHLLEEADIEQDAALGRRMLTFVMAGGGFSGVEAIAEVNDFVRDVARRYPHVDPAELRVILVHSGPRILPELPASLSRYAQTMLTRRKVEIRLQLASPRSLRMRPTSLMALYCLRKLSSPRFGHPRTPCCWPCPASQSGGFSSSTRRSKSQSTQGCGLSAIVPTSSIIKRGSPAHPRHSMRCVRAGEWRGTSWQRSRAPRHALLRSQIG